MHLTTTTTDHTGRLWRIGYDVWDQGSDFELTLASVETPRYDVDGKALLERDVTADFDTERVYHQHGYAARKFRVLRVMLEQAAESDYRDRCEAAQDEAAELRRDA